jgi:hypothetical protein
VAEIVLFSAPKPFTNPHIALIQRNAIRSWLQLGDRVEVLLLGEEDGLAEAGRELGVRHISLLRRTESGTPLISSMLEEARRASDAPIMAIINADIILLPGFVETISKVAVIFPHFLVLGHRWDLDLREPIDFSHGWDTVLRKKIDSDGKLHKSKGSDYFVFRREALHPYPDFAIGRAGWDNWTIYHARAQGWPVIDATHDVTIVHQQHDYSHLPGGVKHYTHPESDYNLRLAGGKRFIFTLLDANRVLVDGRILPYPNSWQKTVRDFERYPVLHSGSRFWMDVFFYLTHPVKFIRHKLPGIARLFGLKRPLEDDD